MPVITLDELHSFHSIDRQLFLHLVMHCRRDPTQALLIMALWLWLEDKGYPHLIQKLLSLSDPSSIDLAYSEATSCLRILESTALITIPEGGDLPLTSAIAGKKISLNMFTHNRFTAISGVKRFLNSVCVLVFADILQCLLPQEEVEKEGGENNVMVPGFPHPVFGDVMGGEVPLVEMWRWERVWEMPPEEERTMFLTFSRGFPVTAEEVEELFRRLYGDCVESIEMETVGGQQPLYGRMVLRSVSSIDRILNGKSVSKFRVNGKHIWARKYEKRDPG